MVSLLIQRKNIERLSVLIAMKGFSIAETKIKLYIVARRGLQFFPYLNLYEHVVYK